MSAIKKFFEKKKTDAKFKMAGSGQKLGDANAAADAANRAAKMAGAAAQRSTSASSSGASRQQLTHEKKLAASAALDRLSKTSNSDDFEKRRSQAAIRAQAKKELEKEQQISQEAQKLKETYGEKQIIEVEAPTAANAILYKCPLIGDQVLPKEEMKEAIRSFLYSQLGEEPGLTSCLIIHTLNKEQEKTKLAVDTLCKYLDNIVQNPTEEKFRKIRKSNKAFQERVGSMEGTEMFLEACGFQNKTIEDQEFWVFPAEADLEILQMLKEALIGAEPIRAELDRGLKVLLPSQVQRTIALPPDFFALSPEELKREQQLKTELAEREGMLRTKAMREREEMKERRKYRFALIRIRFPDGLVLQGTFSVYEKFRQVEEFVTENLEHALPFVLVDSASGQRLDDDSTKDSALIDLGLIPACILTFAWHPEVVEEVKQQLGPNAVYLKDDIATLANSY